MTMTYNEYGYTLQTWREPPQCDCENPNVVKKATLSRGDEGPYPVSNEQLDHLRRGGYKRECFDFVWEQIQRQEPS